MKTIKDAVIDQQKLIDERIISKGGKHDGCITQIEIKKGFCVLLSQSEFDERAKELGYINGYRWGIEYPTNGKRPDLPDTLLVKYQHKTDGEWLKNPFPVDSWAWEETSKAFKIVDEAHRPADTSYLDIKPKDHIVELNKMADNAQSCWPPVAGMAVELWHGGQYIEDVEFLCERGGNVVFWRYSNDSVDSAVMPTAELRPIRTEREKVIEAAVKIYDDKKCFSAESFASELHKAGMLVLPPNKSDTKD